VRNGHVRVNGRLVVDPEAPVRLEHDKILVDGSRLPDQSRIYLAMNKPRAVVTSASDEQGRRTVYDLLPSEHAWVGPVGRLDKASEGLLLLTNDSEWAARITDPLSHLDKTYHVQIDRRADQELISSLTLGVTDRGERLSARSVRMLRQGQKNSWLEIVLDEGKNRQIRRLLAAFEIHVLRLIRVSIGSLDLGDLKKGSVRSLSPAEKLKLDQTLRGKHPKKTAGACR
jgi:23S rRNA pseudouridine2605 synthase